MPNPGLHANLVTVGSEIYTHRNPGVLVPARLINPFQYSDS